MVIISREERIHIMFPLKKLIFLFVPFNGKKYDKTLDDI